MTSTTGGEAIVNGLVAHGVDTVFGLPGAQIYGLFDAFQQAQLQVIGARHEQACGYMAYGYARSTGTPARFNLLPPPALPHTPPPFPPTEHDSERITAAAASIAGSTTPMIFVGSGAIPACDEILELAELIDAPVVAFRSGRGIVSNAHELGLTMAAAYRLWPQTDLMIGIGTRLELPTMSRWPFRPDGLKSIRIDIDPSEMRRFTPDAAVIADAKAGTSELLAALRRAGYGKTRGRRPAIREASAAAPAQIH